MVLHNIKDAWSYLKEDKNLNVVVPCHKMLKKALKLDQVHTFGSLSMSQLIEKIDLMTEIAFFN